MTAIPSGKSIFCLVSTILRRLGNTLPIESNVLRPMIIVCPVVLSLKNFKSSGKCHGISFSKPMTRFLSIATNREIIILLVVLSDIFKRQLVLYLAGVDHIPLFQNHQAQNQK